MNFKTGIKQPVGSTAYAREYYRRFNSVAARGAVDKRTLRKGIYDWVSRARSQMKTAARNRGIPFDLSLSTAWLHEQFERQRGRCFYTGIRFASGKRRFREMRGPSLDRVDSSKGYERGNVVWCLTAINYLKNDYPASDVMALLDDIRRHHRR